ncbi:MAG: ABC transporter substrate-binding protein [Oscillibacter sp.]
MKKKLLSLALAGTLALSLTACGGAAPAPAAPDAAKDHYVVGICQLVQHDALDAATQGFQDALTEALGDKVTFDKQNASGDSPTCSTICGQFVSNGVDLILANATAALQAAHSATGDIPILGTSVTEYGVALDLTDFTGTVGGNISGTSDLAPLDQQAAMIRELFPQAKNVGILYCSGEPNSVYQADTVKGMLEKEGCTVEIYTFADSNDVAAVTGTACADSDVIYIPTDNTAAACTEAINNVAQPAGVPIVAGEEGICRGCGVATLCINYYDLGVATGKMAVKILTGEADVATMPIEYAPQFTKKYNADLAGALGVTIPQDYTAIQG